MDLVRRQFQLAKEAGINMIRPWRRQQAEEIYDMADELGLLLIGAIPIECMDYWPKVTPYLEKRIHNEVRQMILRDRNHPSIVMWEMFNEILRYPLKRLKHKVSLLARKLDSSRLIIDESGGFSGGANYYPPGSSEPEPFNDVHKYPNAPLDQQGYDLLLALGKMPEQITEMGLNPAPLGVVMLPGKLTNISELGYGSIPMLEDNAARYEREGNPKTPDYRYHMLLYRSYKDVLKRTGMDQIYRNLDEFCLESQEIHATGNKLMLEAARINPDVAGIGIHSLTDGDWIVGAGLLDIFGNPKRPYFTAQQVYADWYIAVRTNKCNFYAGDPLHIVLTSVNDQEEFAAKITVEVVKGGTESVWSTEFGWNTAEGIGRLEDIQVDTSGWSGRYVIRVNGERSGSATVKNEFTVYAIGKEQLNIAGSCTVAVVETKPLFSRFLRGLGIKVTHFDPDLSTDIPVIVAELPEMGNEIFMVLQDWVKRGGSAVFLKMPNLKAQITRSTLHIAELEAGSIFPFALKLTPVRGLWNPANHVIKDHPIFAGLPANCMMGQTYQNIYPTTGLIEPASDWIAGCILYSWNKGAKHKMNYLGVTEAYDAAELIAVPYGSGKYVLSTLRLAEQIGKDPVADLIVRNLVHWLKKD
jgi:hypothetical protein